MEKWVERKIKQKKGGEVMKQKSREGKGKRVRKEKETYAKNVIATIITAKTFCKVLMDFHDMSCHRKEQAFFP